MRTRPAAVCAAVPAAHFHSACSGKAVQHYHVEFPTADKHSTTGEEQISVFTATAALTISSCNNRDIR